MFIGLERLFLQMETSLSSPHRLTVSHVPGTVFDCQSGLVWLPPADPKGLSYMQACEGCSEGSPLGRQGWRLPQIGELVDFLFCADAGELDLSPPVATAVWSASRAPLSGEEAMRVAVWGPEGVRLGVRAPLKQATVWLVRGGGDVSA